MGVSGATGGGRSSNAGGSNRSSSADKGSNRSSGAQKSQNTSQAGSKTSGVSKNDAADKAREAKAAADAARNSSGFSGPDAATKNAEKTAGVEASKAAPSVSQGPDVAGDMSTGLQNDTQADAARAEAAKADAQKDAAQKDAVQDAAQHEAAQKEAAQKEVQQEARAAAERTTVAEAAARAEAERTAQNMPNVDGAKEVADALTGHAKQSAEERAAGFKTGTGTRVGTRSNRMETKGSLHRGADGWTKDKRDVADEAGGKKSSFGSSFNTTIAATELSKGDVSFAKGTFVNDGAAGRLTANAHLGRFEHRATASVGTNRAEVSGGLSAQLAGVEAKTESVLGSKDNGVDLQMGTRALLGGEMTGKARVTYGRDGVGAELGLDAFAGAKAGASIRGDLNIGGHHLGSVGAGVEAYAGAGVKANAAFGFENGRLKADLEFGAALGVGIGGKVNVDVDLRGVTGAAMDVANYAAEKATAAADAVSAGASRAAGAVAAKAREAWGAVSSWW